MNRIKLFSCLAVLALSQTFCQIASALTISAPSGDSFGALPGATFGGSGIDNTQVQIAQSGEVTLGLTVTPRYSNPAVTNDGAGVFTAQAGGDILDSAPSYAKWNVDFYVNGLTPWVDSFELFYDNDPSSVNSTTSSVGAHYDWQDSYNLGMGFLDGASFDPSANGQYAFALYAYDAAGAVITHADILVNVGTGAPTVPDGGNMVMLMGGAFMGLLFFRRRFAQ